MRQTTTLHRLSRWVILCVCLFGASSFAGYSPYPDLSILTSAENGSKYLVEGGARFQISPSEYSAYSLYPLRFTVAQSTIDSITTVPRDNTVLKERTADPVYVVIGGRKWHIPSPEELAYWGGSSAVKSVPTNSLRLDSAYNYLLVRERTGTQIYVMVEGWRYAVNTQADLAYYGGESWVWTIPLGSLHDTYVGPGCGQFLREISGSTTYLTGRIHAATTLSKRAVSEPAEGIVPDGALASIPTTTASFEGCIR